MVGGIALMGVVTASLASWLIDRVSAVETENRQATQADIQALRLHGLERLLARHHDYSNASTGAKRDDALE